MHDNSIDLSQSGISLTSQAALSREIYHHVIILLFIYGQSFVNIGCYFSFQQEPNFLPENTCETVYWLHWPHLLNGRRVLWPELFFIKSAGADAVITWDGMTPQSLVSLLCRTWFPVGELKMETRSICFSFTAFRKGINVQHESICINSEATWGIQTRIQMSWCFWLPVSPSVKSSLF